MAAMQGWLEKESGRLSRWQWRWFVLKDDGLYYYKDDTDIEHKDTILFSEIRSVAKSSHSGKAHCLILVGEKKGGKTYYLAAQSEAQRDQWYSAIMPHIEGDAYVRVKEVCKYATVDVFTNRGVRVSGDVGFSILKDITNYRTSGLVAKTRDENGWYCNQEVPLCYILNLFASHGWVAEKVFPSLTTDPLSEIEGEDLLSVIKVVLSMKKNVYFGPQGRLLTFSSVRDRTGSGFEGSGLRPPTHSFSSNGSFSSDSVNNDNYIDGTDEELLRLMEEFNIPISLVEKDTITRQVEALGYH